jgi:ketosteroid isomerase-like protein
MDADEFAREWIEAWNAHDLERILSHYSRDVVFTSPVAAQIVPESEGVIRGIDALRSYWASGLERVPDLHFDLVDVLHTVDGVTILYRNQRDLLVAETVFFDAHGLVTQGFAAYEQ